MDNGLSPYPKGRQAGEEIVLILIVMDNGLSLVTLDPNKGLKES